MINNDYVYKSEMLILILLQKQKREFNEIETLLKDYSQNTLSIQYGILFTLLYHLEMAQLITHTIQDQKDYYEIEEAGQVRLEMLIRKYKTLSESIETMIIQEGNNT